MRQLGSKYGRWFAEVRIYVNLKNKLIKVLTISSAENCIYFSQSMSVHFRCAHQEVLGNTVESGSEETGVTVRAVRY